MEAILIHQYLQQSKVKSHQLRQAEEPDDKKQEEVPMSAVITGYVISGLVTVYAAYLSWSCNTANNVDMVEKVIRAIFAALFSWSYLIIYFIFWRTDCNLIKTKRK